MRGILRYLDAAQTITSFTTNTNRDHTLWTYISYTVDEHNTLLSIIQSFLGSTFYPILLPSPSNNDALVVSTLKSRTFLLNLIWNKDTLPANQTYKKKVG